MNSTALLPPTRMTLEQTAGLLTVIVSLDPRMSPPDETTAKIRVTAWWKILQEVDPLWATRYVEHAYSQLRDFPITVAEIRHEWLRASERDETAARRDDERRSGGRATPLVMDWVRASYASVRAGGQVLPIPAGVGRLSPEADLRQRRCRFHTLCACPHTHCRDGWEDAPHEIRDAMDRPHEAVKRCAQCNDALLMAEERGTAKRPHGHGRRR